MLFFLLLLSFVLLLGWSLFPYFFETPKYTIIKKENGFEIRKYSDALIAKSIQVGSREKALRAGFSELASYIGGSSKEKVKINMTVPVVQERQVGMDSWKTLFFLPKKFSISNVPVPSNNSVSVEIVSGKILAVIKFNGSPNDALLESKSSELERWIKDLGFIYDISGVRYAFYHGPMTPGFLRKNEILIPINNA